MFNGRRERLLQNSKSGDRMRRIHSQEDQLLSLWTLEWGSQDVSALVSYAGALGAQGQASGHLHMGGGLRGSYRVDH